MEGIVDETKESIGRSQPLSGGVIGEKRKMRLSLNTDLSTPPLISSEELVTPLAISMPPSPSSLPSPTSSRHSSPTHLPAVMNLKRNPKRLSLSIPTSEAGPSNITVRDSITPPSDNDNVPLTPGPSRQPGMTMTLGRMTKPRRPNLLSLITQPPSAYDVPPTPGFLPYPTTLPRRRSNTAEEPLPLLTVDPRLSRSAYPRLSTTCAPISEMGPRVASPVATSSSHAESSSSTASSSPSLTQIETPYPSRSEPYADGPVEIVPGVYLGAEDTMYDWSSWAKSKRVRILNVAQEIDDPFEAQGTVPISKSSKGNVHRAIYPANEVEGRPEVDYCHLAWSHGESGLAEVDSEMVLADVIRGSFTEESVGDRGTWRFWEAIRYMEQGRQRGEAVLIQ